MTKIVKNNNIGLLITKADAQKSGDNFNQISI